MCKVRIQTRSVSWAAVFTLSLSLYSFPACGDENIGFTFYGDAMGHSLARAGMLAPDLKDDLIKVAVIVDGNGASFPIYIQNNPKAVIELRNQLRRFDQASFQATLVGTPDFSLLFYAPLSAVREHGGIELVDFLQPFSSCKKRFAKNYVHHAAGGRALKVGAVSSNTKLPEKIKVPAYKESGPLPSANPSNAHFIVAYGDTTGVLRAIYLDGSDLVPFLQTMLKHSDAPGIHGLLARASYLAANSGDRYGVMAIVLLFALAGIAAVVFWWRQRKRSAEKCVGHKGAPADTDKLGR